MELYNQISLLFAGDFAANDRTIQLLESKDFERIFNDVKDIIQRNDYSVVNCESPIVKPSYEPINKVGPYIKAPEQMAEAIKYAGFNMVALANNHMNDYDADGILNTIERCKAEGIDTIGAGKNLDEASRTFIKEIKGKKIAFINCCEHEFSITDSARPGCNPLNPIEQFYAVQEAKKNADYVIVIVHGGIEMYQLPTPRMKKTYRFFIDAGADVIINHHQHCYSGYERYHNGLIFYGLGNFCFDWQSRSNPIWNEGYMVEILINQEDQLDFKLHPYIQAKEQVGIIPMNDLQKDQFNANISELNKIVADENRLQNSYNDFLNKTNKGYRAILSLYSSRISTALCRRGFLPVFYGSYQLRRILLNISCESHVERLQHYINSYLKNIS